MDENLNWQPHVMHPALDRALVPDLDQEDALGQDLGIVEDLALDLDHDPDQEIAGALLEKGEVIQDPGPNQDHLSKFCGLLKRSTHLIF